MRKNHLIELYYDWLLDKVCDDYQRSEYDDMLRVLFYTEFTWIVHRDENRAFDGLDLRGYFVDEHPEITQIQFRKIMPEYCTVLEVLVALAVRCEEIVMDGNKGDRTSVWFWEMIDNLKLDSMDGNYFDEGFVVKRLDIFLSRNYKRDGSDGALFKVPSTKEDFRNMELWYQMNTYLNSINV